jgi:ABC-2 type transport system permease protein
MIGFMRAAWVIGRRDFTATVYSRTFLFFLLGPLIIIGMSVLFGNVMQSAARQDVRSAVAVIAGAQDFEAVQDARRRLLAAFSERPPPELIQATPAADERRQVSELLRGRHVVAVLSGGLDNPRLTGSIAEEGSIRRQMSLIVDVARQDRALRQAGKAPLAIEPIELVRVGTSAGERATVQAWTARSGQLVLFMLTVLLAGMLLSNMLEEKSNKVIEVLAAAVPVDAIFVGKIFSMLGVSIVGIAVWGSGALVAATLLQAGGAGWPEPAVGWPLFVILGVLYYSANYLLLGALFLGIGSQASTVREVQTLSMPVTVGQMLFFAFASVAVGRFNSPVGIAAAVFPFSSPLAMVARAAQSGELWPHLLALAWQALWVWLTVRLSARLFRRNVLKSGAPSGLFGRRKRAEATA